MEVATQIDYEKAKELLEELIYDFKNNEKVDIKYLINNWHMSHTQARKILNEYREEILRKDTKIPNANYYEISQKGRWTDQEEFEFFMKNYNFLKNPKTRKYVKEFKKKM